MEKEQSSLATDNGFSLDLFLGDKEKLAGMWSASEAGTSAAVNEDASETQKIAVEIPVLEEVSEMEPAENDESANEVWETLEAEKEQVRDIIEKYKAQGVYLGTNIQEDMLK